MGDTVGKLSAGTKAAAAAGAEKAVKATDASSKNPQDIPLHRPMIGKEGTNLLKSYMSGSLTGGEKEVINQFKKSANASLQQELSQAGLSRSSAAFGGKEAIDAQAAQIAQGFLQQDFSNAVSLLGMNMNAYFQQAGIDVNKEMANAQQDAGFAQALGSIGEGIAIANT